MTLSAVPNSPAAGRGSFFRQDRPGPLAGDDVPGSMTADRDEARRPARSDIGLKPRGMFDRVLLAVFVVVPFLAVLAAVPLLWGWGLGWHDLVIAGVMYVVSGLGVTVGFHRYFTHGSFKAKRPVRIALAVAGSLAIEMSVVDWVAAHRCHHKYSDRDGDPHSPWRFGDDWSALTKGFVYAHLGWLFARDRTSTEKFCPDLLADRDIRRISANFPALVAASLLLPPLVGGLWGMSLHGALTAFFWGTLVRIANLHHVTFAINSICHIVGAMPFDTRDNSRNVWWLAIPSFGESWHNLHHAIPTSARHGALRGQPDVSARVIWAFEKLGWAHDVRWPSPEHVAAKHLTRAPSVT